MHRASHPWPIFYSADKQSLLAILTGEPIPKQILFFSKDKSLSRASKMQ